MKTKADYGLIGATIIMILAFGLSNAQQVTTPNEPAVIPCPDNPEVYCRGSVDEPKYIGVRDCNEGEPGFVCITVLDCNYSEGVLAMAEPITIQPAGCLISSIQPVDCNDVNDICGDEKACFHLYLTWADTKYKSGQ